MRRLHPEVRDTAGDLVGLGTSQSGEAFPVGAAFLSFVSTNPATLLGYGTWTSRGMGRVLVGVDAGQAAGDLLGTATHGHDSTQADAHAALTHAGATVGAHTFTQPAGHSAHLFTQPGSHAFTQPGAHSDHGVQSHSAHGGATVGNHAFTQPGAHSAHVVTQPSAHADNIAHTHGLNVQGGTTAATTGTHVMTSTATGGSARAITSGDAGLSQGTGASLTHTGAAVDAHSAHSGGAVDAHSVGQASAHSDHAALSHSAHSGGAVDAHAGGAVDAHSAHSGGAVDAHSVGQPNQHAAQSHTGSGVASATHLPPAIAVYIWERTA